MRIRTSQSEIDDCDQDPFQIGDQAVNSVRSLGRVLNNLPILPRRRSCESFIKTLRREEIYVNDHENQYENLEHLRSKLSRSRYLAGGGGGATHNALGFRA